MTVRYGYTGAGDSSAFTTDALGLGVQDRTVGLVGGVLLTKRTTGDVWNYPNIHGDLVATADPAGAKRGGTIAYDPFGKSLTPSGSTNPDGVPDNSAGNLDYGWLGQHQRGLEHAGGLATIEMGARQYVPAIGRFLQVDPVEAGSCNDYDYVCGDPVNGRDLLGLHHEDLVADAVDSANRAEEIAGLVGERAQRHRTVAVIKAERPDGSIVYVVGSGGAKLTGEQSKEVGRIPGEIEAPYVKGRHAEENALDYIISQGWRPISGGASRPVCRYVDRCRKAITDTNGMLIGPRAFIW